MNTHDSVLFPDTFEKLLSTTEKLHLSLKNVPLTLDSGFDSVDNVRIILSAGLVPVIKPNFRKTKDKKIIRKRTRSFEKIKNIYVLRHTVERGFAWQDKYRKLVIRYERLTATFHGFRYLAGAMVNYREVFGKSL